MTKVHHSSSLANWNVLPAGVLRHESVTEEQQAAAESAAPASAPLFHIGEDRTARDHYTAEEWQEWCQLQQRNDKSDWPTETAPDHFAHHSAQHGTYYSPSASLSAPPPTLAEDLALSFAAGAQAFLAAMKRGPDPEWEQRSRLASTSTMIDHGSPPASPDLLDLPDLSSTLAIAPKGFTKEEWLRLGGFNDFPSQEVEAAARQASAPKKEPQRFEVEPPLYASPADLERSPERSLPLLPELPSLPPTPRPTSTQKARPRKAPSSRPKKPVRAWPYPQPSVDDEVDKLFLETGDDLPVVGKNLGTFNLAPIPSATSDIPFRAGKKHTRAVSANHIPRPRNAFILFRQHALATKLIPSELGIKQASNASQVIGAVWKSLPREEKAQWEKLAAEEKEAHRLAHPNYVFKPKSKGERRKQGTGKKALAKAKRAAERLEEENIEVDELDSELDEGDEYSPKSSPAKKSPSKKKASASPRKKATPAVPSELFFPKESSEDKAARMEMVGQLIGFERRADGGQPAPNSPHSNRSTPRRIGTRHGPYNLASSPTTYDIQVRSSSPLSASSSSASTPRRLRPTRGSRDDSSPVGASPNRQRDHRQPKSFGSLGIGGPALVESSCGSQRSPCFPTLSATTSFTSDRPPAASVPFDNSPLFGAGAGERKSSLGRWELRRPSERRVSRRELLAQEEEDEMSDGRSGGPRRREVSKAFAIDPRLFLAEAGLEEEEYDAGSSGGGGGGSSSLYSLPSLPVYGAGDPSKVFSATKQHYALPPSPPTYHYGAQNLFSAPADDVFGSGRKARTTSESAMGFGGEGDGESESSYSRESRYNGGSSEVY